MIDMYAMPRNGKEKYRIGTVVQSEPDTVADKLVRWYVQREDGGNSNT